MAQETYISKTREAGRRARQLRKAGFHVTTCSLGWQILDPEGPNCRGVNMTLVSVYDAELHELPAPEFTPTRP